MAHVEVGAEIMTPPAKPEVEVLLATYYGERFLREQINSIPARMPSKPRSDFYSAMVGQ